MQGGHDGIKYFIYFILPLILSLEVNYKKCIRKNIVLSYIVNQMHGPGHRDLFPLSIHDPNPPLAPPLHPSFTTEGQFEKLLLLPGPIPNVVAPHDFTLPPSHSHVPLPTHSETIMPSPIYRAPP